MTDQLLSCTMSSRHLTVADLESTGGHVIRGARQQRGSGFHQWPALRAVDLPAYVCCDWPRVTVVPVRIRDFPPRRQRGVGSNHCHVGHSLVDLPLS